MADIDEQQQVLPGFQTLEDAATIFGDPEESLDSSAMDRLREYIKAKALVKELKDTLADAEAKRDDLRSESLDIMDNAGIQKITIDGVTLSPSSRKWFFVNAENRDESHGWLEDNGFEALIKSRVNAQALSAQLSEFETLGHEIPDHLFNTRVDRRL